MERLISDMISRHSWVEFHLFMLMHVLMSLWGRDTAWLVTAQTKPVDKTMSVTSRDSDSFEAKMDVYGGHIYFLLSDSKRELSQVASCAIKVGY